jgi:MoaA/NifB/PqqE/SkfB family radical SAM enzyme
VEFLSEFDTPVHVIFTGGDPILYDNLIELCTDVSRLNRNISIGLYTSGNYKNMEPIANQYAAQLAACGISECYMSVYSFDPLVLDMWTTEPGSYNNMLVSARNLKAAGIDIKAHIVVNQQNYLDLGETIRFCEDFGFSEARLLKLAPTGNAKENWETIGIPLETQNTVIKQLMESKYKFNISLTFAGYPHLHSCRPFKDAKKCQAGCNLLYITLLGEIFPCAATISDSKKFKIGDISQMGLVFDMIKENYNFDYRDNCLNAI